MAKYQVISRFSDQVIIEGDDYTQPTKPARTSHNRGCDSFELHFLPDEQSQFPGSGGMDDNNLTEMAAQRPSGVVRAETMGICYFYVVNRSADE